MSDPLNIPHVSIGRGGARPGAGRPKRSSRIPEGAAPPDMVNFEISHALLEATKAKNAELHYQIRLGEYVNRDAVRASCAAGLATFAQAMRSMPDQMERDLALGPDAVEAIGAYIDAALDQLATTGIELYRK